VDTLNAQQVKFHWKHNHPIATYLIAIAVTNYTELRSTVNLSRQDSIQIIDYAYPEEQTQWRANQIYAKQAMQFYCERFVLYPFANEKYGHARFPWGGGMEHQTMSFMYNLSEDLVIHELAHQWFGDHITCGSWNHVWLNEGFATYCEGLYTEHYHPGSFKEWRRENSSFVVSAPGGSVYCYNTSDENAIFNSRLSYSKGGMVLHLLRKQVGDTAFFAGIRSYLRDPNLAGGFATTEDFRAHIESAADTTLVEFFDQWIYKQGYPSYTVYWQPGETKTWVKIAQTQSHTSVPFFKLKVPVQFIAASKDTIVWLHHTENEQLFNVDLGFCPTSVRFDPNYEMMTRNNQVIKGRFAIPSLVDNPIDEKIKIYPNPSQVGKISVQSMNKMKQISIYTLDGKRILQNDSPKKDMDFSLNSGVYLVKITLYDDVTYTEKVIIQ
jgi:aminopeptidase N